MPTVAPKQLTPGSTGEVLATRNGGVTSEKLKPDSLNGVTPVAGQIPYIASTSEFGTSSDFTWDNSNKQLSVGGEVYLKGVLFDDQDEAPEETSSSSSSSGVNSRGVLWVRTGEPNTLVYTDNQGTDTTLGAGGGGGGGSGAPVLVARKTSDTGRTSDITPAADPHLTLSLAESSTYLVEGVVYLGVASDSNLPDLRVELAYSGTLNVMKVDWFDSNVSDAAVTTGADVVLSHEHDETPDNVHHIVPDSATTTALRFRAYVATTTAGDLSLDWAQWTSSTNTLTLKERSWISAINTAGTVSAGNDTEVMFNDGGVLAGNSGFTFDKTTGNVDVSTDGATFRLPVKTDAGDPAGADGMLYYSDTAQSFRKYENGAWQDLSGTSLKYGRKSGNSTRSNTTTISTDSDFTLSLSSGVTYLIEGVIYADKSNTTDDPDIRLELNYSSTLSSAQFDFWEVDSIAVDSIGSDGVLAHEYDTTPAEMRFEIGDSKTIAIRVRALITTSGAGDLTVDYAQWTASANTDTRVLAGSWLSASGGTFSSRDAQGSDTQVQFNDGGDLNGDSGFTYNKSTGVLGVASIAAVGAGADEDLNLSAKGDGGVKISGRMFVIKDTGAVLAVSDSGSALTDVGAGSQQTYTLPSAQAGMTFPVGAITTNGVKINAATGDTIRIYDTVSTTAGYIQSTNQGASLVLICVDATQWVAFGTPLGVWTVDE